ncbi:MAG: YhcH/YjgK/YiaL family protein [Candidatus Delongbacteria bacterium]|nr:YhcH/YjgK/YiaL family protein [Candidatus Delongbacteria bacterium]MBN2835979.1 YhcH/YjgK/YiaL family protein [Candidatus Delongbacteria bacterium]
MESGRLEELLTNAKNQVKNALKFMIKTDFSSYAEGRYEVDENMFFIVNQYQTKETGLLEVHRKYIDIQFMISGSEKIGFEKLRDQEISQVYNTERDIAFFYGNFETLVLTPGFAAIFYPDDLHAPGLINENKESIKKIVMKVKV